MYQDKDAEMQLGQEADVRVPVHEEELVIGKQPREAGRVHVHKDVVDEPQTLDVLVNREHVVVERAPYSGPGGQADEAFLERDIDVPLMGEEVVVEKRVRGVEEIAIHKEVVTEQRRVSDTVRKERVTIDGIDVAEQTRAGATAPRGAAK